ncbi:MAG: glutamate-5-semialdehyde dehydrogenase [Planctomyces sp.]|nr:glutamate-5-semialdehyde dehydrogenase [Planctomyces sp.]
MEQLQDYTQRIAKQAREAAVELSTISGATRNKWLKRVAQELRDSQSELLAANEQDLKSGTAAGLSSALLDRLRLTPSRLEDLAQAVEQIAALPDPVGEVIEGGRRPNGLQILKIRVPLGVVFFIYESRPNVTIDAAAICIKSGNAVILRGGKEAIHSNLAFASILQKTLKEVGLPEHAAQIVESTDREAVGQFLRMNQWIDVAIPRGGRSLIERVTAEARMPVIKHFDGICHVFVDESADEQMAVDVLINSKCQRPGVCNAAETLLIHQAAADRLLGRLAEELQKRGVELRCCPFSFPKIPNAVPATEQDFRTEYLALVMSVKIVDSIEHAIRHIREYGSSHTDAIVTQNTAAAAKFETCVDSAAVMVNASTRFNDGGEFGLGAEIGISTDRFHARGPCGLREMTTYKYVVRGNGQIR